MVPGVKTLVPWWSGWSLKIAGEWMLISLYPQMVRSWPIPRSCQFQLRMKRWCNPSRSPTHIPHYPTIPQQRKKWLYSLQCGIRVSKNDQHGVHSQHQYCFFKISIENNSDINGERGTCGRVVLIHRQEFRWLNHISLAKKFLLLIQIAFLWPRFNRYVTVCLWIDGFDTC